MLAHYFLNGLFFGLCLSIVSWMVGITGGGLLRGTRYFSRLSRLNFIPSAALNQALGIAQFKWIVKNSSFRVLNLSLRVDGKRTDLAYIRDQMTTAEINHLIGFLFVAFAAVYMSVRVGVVYGLSMMIPNVLLNGYPTLLQQENKRRIDQLLNRRGSIPGEMRGKGS